LVEAGAHYFEGVSNAFAVVCINFTYEIFAALTASMKVEFQALSAYSR
jgi:hypothetical protein